MAFLIEKNWVGRLRRLADDEALSWLTACRQELPEAEWYLVGGMVRDAGLGRERRKDFDLLVRKAGFRRLESWLSQRGRVSFVGRNFGVLKFRPNGSSEEIDIAWPRTERAGMSGAYRDFQVNYDADLPVETDLARRDFTVNAMAWDFAGERLIDPFDGRADLAARRLRAVGKPAARFQEDLSRILRGWRFACELALEIDPETWRAMTAASARLAELGPAGVPLVPAETVARELTRMLAADPGRAARLLDEGGALPVLLPELHRLRDVPQPPEWHSEGDAWTHTRLAMDFLGGPLFADFFPGTRPSPLAVVGTLFHDVGKAVTAKVRDGKMTFWGHAEAGADLTAAIAERWRLASAGIDVGKLTWLVREHMFPHLVDLEQVRKTTLRARFLADAAAGEALLHLYVADVAASWRPDGRPDFFHAWRLLAEVARLRAADREPLLTGTEVMATTGLAPGPEIGRLLEQIREEQLHGRLKTEQEAKDFLLRRPAAGPAGE